MPATADSRDSRQDGTPQPNPASDRAQLSALQATLDDITRRVAQIADPYQGSTREHIANGLYEVERSLLAAGRQLAKLMRELQQST